MNKPIFKPVTTAVVLAAWMLSSALAQAGDKASFDLRAAAGYQYDSNVSVDELDTSTGQADNALLLEMDADGRVPLGDTVSFSAGYGFSQTRYDEFSQFDTAIHRLQGELSWRVAGLDTSLAMRHFAARLDGERFLDIRQVSPAVGHLFGRTLYLRGAYTHSDKQYADREARNADNRAFDADAYWLLDGMQRYVALSYRVDGEDAVDDELDYDGNRVKLTYAHTLDGVPLTFKAKWQLENRDYRHVTESIEAARDDRRTRLSLNANWQFAEHVGIEGTATRADYRSNLAAADYDEMVYSLNIAASF